MANSAFDHSPTITVPSSTVNNRVVTWDGTTGKIFDDVATVTINAGVVAGVTSLLLTNSSNAYGITLNTGATGANYTITMPTAAPAAGKVLKTTSGSTTQLEWGDAGGGSTDFSCRAKSTASQALDDSQHELIVLDDEDFDTDGMHDESTNNSRINFNSDNAGTYVVLGQLGFAGHATGQRIVRLLVNGTAVARIARSVVGSSTVECLMIGMIWTFSAGNYVEMSGFQSSGGSLGVAVFSQEGPYLMVAKVG